MKTKAVIYARVSTDRQKTKVQIEELREYAKLNNFEVVREFDETISGYVKDRDELSALKVFVKENNIKQILCYELSRIGRSARQTLNEIDYFTKEGVNIYLKKDNLNTLNGSSTNKFLLNILTVVADFEVSTFKERSAGGIRSAILSGKANGLADMPYGFAKDANGKIVINEQEAKVVRLIYSLCNKGTSLYGISEHLKSLGIKAKRKDIWYPKVLRTLLKKPIYKGVRVYKDVDVQVPAIVSVEEWDNAQQRFEYNIGYINRSTHPYLFKGKLRCGECGKAWVSHTKKNGYSFYRCSNVQKFKGKICENSRFVNTKLVDRGVFIGLFSHPDLVESVLSDEEKKNRANELQTQATIFKNEITQNEEKIKRAVNAYIDGRLAKSELAKKEKSYKKVIQNLQDKILIIEKELSYKKDINLSDLLHSIYRSEEYSVKRDFVMKYIDKVEMFYVKESNIEWEKPLHQDDRTIYAKVFAFSNPEPVHVIMTTQTNQLMTIAVKEIVAFKDRNLTVAG